MIQVIFLLRAYKQLMYLLRNLRGPELGRACVGGLGTGFLPHPMSHGSDALEKIS